MLQKNFAIISHVNSRFQFIRTFLKQKVSAFHMTLQDKKNKPSSISASLTNQIRIFPYYTNCTGF